MMESRKTTMRAATFTRPANTTAYAAGDAMGAGSAAGGCHMEFPLSHARDARTGKIVGARLAKSDQAALTNDTFRLLLFSDAPATDPDENAAPTTSWVKWADRYNYIGSIDFEVAEVHADCAMYEGQDLVPSVGIPFQLKGADSQIYGILTALGAYTPGSAEIFTIQLEIEQ